MGRKSRGQLDPAKYSEIREYLRTHSIDDAVKEYDLSRTTIAWVKRFDDFREMKQKRADEARKYQRKANNVTPPDYRIGDIAPGEPKPITSPFEPGAEPKAVMPVDVKKAPQQDGEVITRPATHYQGKTAWEWWKEFDKQRNAYDKAIAEFSAVSDERDELREQVRLQGEQLKEATSGDWKYQYDLVCKDRQKIWDELQALKKAANGGAPLDPANTIIVTVGETRVEIPINIKQ